MGELLDQSAAFFKNTGTESVYGQSLLFQDIDVTEKTDRELSRRQPVGSLAKIAKQRQVHLAKKFSNKRRAKLRMVIKESGIAGAGPCLADVPRMYDNLAVLAFPGVGAALFALGWIAMMAGLIRASCRCRSPSESSCGMDSSGRR